MKTFAIEMPVVSEKYRYGGTVDWLGSIASSGYWLVDFKTSGSLPEHEWQTSAYYKAF